MAGEQFSLCWDNFHKNMSSGMHSLLETEDLVDVTLAVEGKYLKAHKMVLSVCSPYFRELFQMNPCKHPIVFMKDVSYTAMSDLLTFMYQGEVHVNQEQLTTFIKTAEALQIKGLTNDGNNESTTEVADDHVEEVTPSKQPSSTVAHENDVVISKPTPKPRKTVSSHLPAKRQRTSSPVREKASPAAIKIDTAPATEQAHTTEQLIQLKMEPFDSEQSDMTQAEAYEENPDDTFADDGGDETPMDDSEYQTMLKGEEEPQAGTSGDGMGESQDVLNKADGRRRRVTTRMRVVVDGFVYHNNIIAGSPPLRYLGCSELRRSGCRGRATLPVHGDPMTQLKLTHPHNHPPDLTVEEKVTFMKELRRLAKRMDQSSLKHVYETVAELYPMAAVEIPFKSICSSLHRWRKEDL